MDYNNYAYKALVVRNRISVFARYNKGAIAPAIKNCGSMPLCQLAILGITKKLDLIVFSKHKNRK